MKNKEYRLFFSKIQINYLVCLYLFVVLAIPVVVLSQNVGINTTGAAPNISAILDINATDQGLLIPRMTDAQRQALKDPATGLMIYNTNSNKLNFYNGTGWQQIDGNSVSVVSAVGTGAVDGIAISLSGNSPDHSAILDLSATDKGLLLPRTTQGAVTTITGLIIYNTTTNEINYYDGTSWQSPCPTFIDNNKGTGASGGGVAINGSGDFPDFSAILDVSSPDKGVLLPRMTSVQRDAIKTPAQGLIVYNTSDNRIEHWTGSAWHEWVYSVPAQPGAISGTSPVCRNQNGVAYSVTNVSGVSYTWSYSGTGLTVASGQGGNAITANFSGTATSGTLTVTPSNACGDGSVRTYPITINTAPSVPSAGTHTPSKTQVVWNWNTVSGATGYKYNTVNDYATATDNGASVTHTQTGLTCNTAYTLYVWAYNSCGNSSVRTLNQTTSACYETTVVMNGGCNGLGKACGTSFGSENGATICGYGVRVVTAVIPLGPGNPPSSVFIRLNSAPTNAFNSIVIGGVTLTAASATTSTNTSPDWTQWSWGNGTDFDNAEGFSIVSEVSGSFQIDAYCD